MCLINFHLQDHPQYKLVIAANRDELYNRPAAPAHFWEDEPTILAGRDLEQMGTWLGITKHGRFAALTNFRDPTQHRPNKRTRGEVITNFLTSRLSPEKYLRTIHKMRDEYNGFNVLVGNSDQLFYYNNLEAEIQEVPNGTHGLSNHLLNTPWPKVTKGKDQLRNYVMNHVHLDIEHLFTILANDGQAADHLLPSTGVGIVLERKLSPLFIKTPDYGTRCSTVILIDHNNRVTFAERTYQDGVFANDLTFSFQIT